MIAPISHPARLALALAPALFVALPSFAQDSRPRQLPSCRQQQPMQVASTIKKNRASFWWTPSSPTKKGNYIHDLSQSDFKVYEDR